MEPIILFGETELEAYQRLRKLEFMEPEVNKVSMKFDISKLYIIYLCNVAETK